VIAESHPEVALETNITDGITVEADDLVTRLFSNLFLTPSRTTTPRDSPSA